MKVYKLGYQSFETDFSQGLIIVVTFKITG